MDPASVVRDHWLPALLAVLFGVGWIATEYYARRSTWRQGAPRRPRSTLDQGTYPIIAIGLLVSEASAAIAFLSGAGIFLPFWATVLGAIAMLVGFAIRTWALVTLGQFFTMPITIRDDHRLIRAGPYRWLRHPAYTGGMLIAIGLPLVLGTLIGFLVAVIACLVVYVYRIRIEERALTARFGDEYRSYARTTWRLIPPIY